MLSYTLKNLQTLALAATMMAGCTIGEPPQERIPGEPYFSDASYETDAWLPPLAVALTDCNGTLVDLLRDDDNCGECGDECPDETSCYEAECRTPSYLDTPCGPEGWCPEEIMRCESFNSGDYCIVPEDWGCEFDDKCPDEEICIAAYCTPIREDICDGIDNDRNGVIDDIMPRICYTGPEGTAGVGNCRSGLDFCIGGLWTGCAGERVPVAEEHILLCDGRDNDCDGCADNNYDPDTGECEDAEPQEYDIVVIVDVSGSMGGVINAAIAASGDFAQAFDGDSNFQFTLFVHPYGQTEPISIALKTPLTEYSIYRAALSGLSTSMPGVTGAEQNYDIPHMIASGAYPEIGFRSTARRVYINLTDEFGQSYPFTGHPTVDETLMCSAFRSEDVVAFFTHPRLIRYFDECSIGFVLRTDHLGMSREMRGLFVEVCNR